MKKVNFSKWASAGVLLFACVVLNSCDSSGWPESDCPGGTCQLDIQSTPDGTLVGAKGDCDKPCECWLMTTSDGKHWEKAKKAGTGWIPLSSKLGVAAICVKE